MEYMIKVRKPKDVIIDGKTLEQILIDHKQWLDGDRDDYDEKRAVLKGVDLRAVDLQGAILTKAILHDVNLRMANLSGANLCYATLRHVNLCDAILIKANLYCIETYNVNFLNADLSNAFLRHAELRNANLSYALLNKTDLSFANLAMANLCRSLLFNTNLYGAQLYNANLRLARIEENVNLNESTLSNANLSDEFEERSGKVLTENIIGYKKCKDGIIVTLEIPRGAIVFSINDKKCRTNKVKVIGIDGADRAFSVYGDMSYYVGDEITVYNFNCKYNVECGSGIHFFRTREEAEAYWS